MGSGGNEVDQFVLWDRRLDLAAEAAGIEPYKPIEPGKE